MACFLRGNIDRPHEVKVYFNAKKGTNYPKYDGSVQVFGQDEKKIEESVHVMFKPPKEIPEWIMASAMKRKELLARQKREKEQKERSSNRFYALSNIDSFYPVASYLDEYERDVLSAVSPEVASKVKYNERIYHNTKYSKEDKFGALNYLGQIMVDLGTDNMKEGSYNDKKVKISILDVIDDMNYIDWDVLKPLINMRLSIGEQAKQTGDLEDRMEDIKRNNELFFHGWVLVQANHKIMVVVDNEIKSLRDMKQWIRHFALICFRLPQNICPMGFRKKYLNLGK
jgi:hypothetical protein